MKDNFEKFVEDNRDEFDPFEPREGLWEPIEERLHKPRKIKPYAYAIAASVLLLAGVIIWLKPKRVENHYVNTTDTVVVHPDEQKAEVYYASIIEEKRIELNKYCKQQPTLCTEFEKELDTLNVLYGRLKVEYSASANNEVVLKAMINNLQIQLAVLSQQLQIIQNIKAKKEQIKVL